MNSTGTRTRRQRGTDPATLEAIREQQPAFLGRARRTGYICPNCGNGSGEQGDGLTLDRSDKTRTHYKCFKCGLYADNLELIGKFYGLDSFPDQVRKACEVFGIEPGTGSGTAAGNTFTRKETERAGGAADQDTPADYSSFYREAEAAPGNYEYLKGRGISEATQKRFHVGFCPDWKHPTKYPESVKPTPRAIIPRSRGSYLARFTGSEEDLAAIDNRMTQPKLNSPGSITLFNAEALKENPVFVVEGEIDAMSIEEAGGHCVGLCSAANRRRILDHLKQGRREGQAFILLLDRDDAGRRAQADLQNALREMGVACVSADLPEGIKDPNDFLVSDPEGLRAFVSSLQAQALEARAQEQGAADQEAPTTDQGDKYRVSDILDYFRNLEEQPEAFEAKTGFSELDREDRNLYGGLHEGLYIIGAISSLGKTTFCLQMADQIAETGQDVLFFSLEMSKYELTAKSLSRRSFIKHRYEKERDGNGGHYIARNTSQILNNRRYKFYHAAEKAAIAEAIEDHAKAAEHLYIYEGRYKGERLTVKHIGDIVRAHIQETGKAPVVFVDYLQIIAPEDPHATDKQNTDINVFELKEISRNCKLPVFAISSFNRENYTEPVSMTSFKESGAVEYSSDVLFGLQYEGMDYKEGEAGTARIKRIRELLTNNRTKAASKGAVEVELKCLKNRNGGLFRAKYYFVPAFNYYGELMFLQDDETAPFTGELKKEHKKRIV